MKKILLILSLLSYGNIYPQTWQQKTQDVLSTSWQLVKITAGVLLLHNTRIRYRTGSWLDILNVNDNYAQHAKLLGGLYLINDGLDHLLNKRRY